jgi:hypothetical protein
MITKFIASQFDREDIIAAFVQEASTLGLSPGCFPSAFLMEVDGVNRVFERNEVNTDSDGDITSVVYVTRVAPVLVATILND